MYMLEEMVEMGLKEKQKWPSPAHRVVAANLAICNPLVTTRDKLSFVVQKVCAIPKDKIKTVTIAELSEYGLGLVVSP